MINVFQPSCGEEELAAVGEVFKSNWLGKGGKTSEFEKKFLDWLNITTGNTISVNSCTEALFQIMQAIGLGYGDEVILPTCHFVGTANAIASTGCKPVFCDIDPRTLNATAEFIEGSITSKTKAVCILHYGGLPCDMDDIVSLCNTKNLILIEDSATAIASSYKNRQCGTFGLAGTWSFDAMKILVCGDGGMIYTPDVDLAHKIRQQTYLGLMSPSGFANSVDTKWWEFQIDCFGRRSIMNDISAAIGITQLSRLPGFINKRKKLTKRYDELLGYFSWLSIPPNIPDHKTSSYYMYWIQLKTEEERNNLARYLRTNNIYSTFRYYPLHLVDLYKQTDVRLTNAEYSSRRTLCLPLHQSMNLDDIDFICTKIYEFKESK